jgi:hypothetical protein
MKRFGVIVLTLALLAVTRLAARPADDDPEPPPPVKVSVTKGVNVKVKAGAGGPLFVVADGAKAKGSNYFQVEFAQKNAPAKMTLRVEGIDRLAVFALMGKQVKSERFLVRLDGQGKQTFHFDASGRELKGEKGARLSFTYEPGKDKVEVIMVRHKDMTWPQSPVRIYWGPTFGKKKKS